MYRLGKEPTPEQIAKLPAWAKQYISNLEYDRDRAVRHRDELFDAQTPTGLVYGTAGDLSTNPKYLPDSHGNYVRFATGGTIPKVGQMGDYLEVSRARRSGRDEATWGDVIEIRSSSGLSIKPSASNAIEITHTNNW